MIRALILAPLLFVMVLFALSNPQPAHLGIWPTDLSLELPLSIALLIFAAVAFLLGALVVWIGALGAHLRVRRTAQSVRMLEAQVADLKQRLAAAEAKPAMQIERPGTAVQSLS